jgi:transposase
MDVDLQALLTRLALLEEALRQRDAKIAELEALLRQRDDRIAELEQTAFRQAAPFRRRDPLKVDPAKKKKPGRPKGHPGSCRAIPQQIEETVEAPLAGCPHCGGQVADIQRIEKIIEEVEPVRPKATRVITYQAECPCCGTVRSKHPLQTTSGPGGSKVQLGPRALALATSLSKENGLTVRTTCRVLKTLCGLAISPGGLTQAMARAADKVRPLYEGLAARIRDAKAVHADETSWWVGGPKWWLWVFTTANETLYLVDKRRGGAVVHEVLGPSFDGMLVSDCLSSYDPSAYRKHKCIAHHQRAIAEARAGPEGRESSYLSRWKSFFVMVISLSKARRDMTAEQFAEERARLELAAERFLAEPVLNRAEQKIRNRLRKQREHLLGCLYEAAAEPTNNRAERALRPAVIARKLSCGNKTVRGKSTWETLASLAVTSRQRGIDFVSQLTTQLQATTTIPMVTG